MAIGQSNAGPDTSRSEEHTSELQSRSDLVCRLLLEKKKKTNPQHTRSVSTTCDSPTLSTMNTPHRIDRKDASSKSKRSVSTIRPGSVPHPDEVDSS